MRDQRTASLFRGDTRDQVTGLAFDLVNLRPDICAVVPEGAHGPAPCDEFERLTPPRRAPLDTLLARMPPNEAVQGGAAAIALAADWARSHPPEPARAQAPLYNNKSDANPFL